MTEATFRPGNAAVADAAKSPPRPVKKNLLPYSGYHTNKEVEHDPELTEVGPGTTMGEYMRSFWHPICMSMELTDTPRFLKILGEELVAFRDKSGQIGVLHAHCVHRGASLEYGAIQERGIMCCYHGMVFDVDGTCIHVPYPKGEEAEAERFGCSIRQGAYKAFERHGLIFAYMGPPENEPPFPEWEENFTVAPTDELVAYSNFQHCNWLQVQDNAADNYHPTALHAGKNVVDGHFQGTTFDEVGANSMEVAPDMQFVPVHQGRSLACAGARRVDSERLFIRVQHQVLPNLSLHAYTSEDGKAQKYFSRFHMIRWTVPVDDRNSKMIGWRVMGPGIDTRGVGDKSLVGYETIDFLEGQVAMRRPERFGKYKLEDMPEIPSDHRARHNYKDAQYAPGDYEAIISQRPIAVHALENPTKFDAGVYAFRKMLREAARGTNPAASAQGFADWLRELNGMPNSYCSGNVLNVREAPVLADEVANRRKIAKQLVMMLTESDKLRGEERNAFVRAGLQKLEQQFDQA
ncbi:Rieske 2Fe-2S domain-containing protein [Methylobacterium mesophilicum SR1.6/6]|uniref:Rieske 2Fe-2S domain-containing protein n=1 Tax=Methylobacterium mesophilicum SR1.6/6 TaxID=908290 RepID=A0A6B9FRD3_9HYPH|nr:Rieske 2Fe-2S domain-containing protein [Methylobacterium mesophilicum]QGY03608.1 Rieske 2Fe-2S domain-containing protein [Methylobacterium mesophilicum SR1.6/6]